jgi:hypothetical protein
MRVEVYWNLHKKCWSVRHKGKVIKHCSCIRLRDVQWVVQPGGQARVRKQGRKNVHAFARGTLQRFDQALDCHRDEGYQSCIELRYNPYINDSFVCAARKIPIAQSRFATLTSVYRVTGNSYRPIAYAYDPS